MKRINEVIKEADAVFLKIDTAVINRLKAIKDESKDNKSKLMNPLEDPFKRLNTPTDPLSSY